jgi:hypothetical protein
MQNIISSENKHNIHIDNININKNSDTLSKKSINLINIEITYFCELIQKSIN